MKKIKTQVLQRSSWSAHTITSTARDGEAVTVTVGCAFEIWDPDEYLWDFTYEARLFDPYNNQIKYAGNWANDKSGYLGIVDTVLTDPEEGSYRCTVDWWVNSSHLTPQQQQTQTLSYATPTSESTVGIGWSLNSGKTTAYWFGATLSGANFVGRKVKEFDGGHATGDTCWFSGSSIDRFEAITQGEWPVGTGNLWSTDEVGWFENAVGYYRSYGRAPCMTDFYQDMKINKGSAWSGVYQTNWLKAGINATSVWSERAGSNHSKSY